MRARRQYTPSNYSRDFVRATGDPSLAALRRRLREHIAMSLAWHGRWDRDARRLVERAEETLSIRALLRLGRRAGGYAGRLASIR